MCTFGTVDSSAVNLAPEHCSLYAAVTRVGNWASADPSIKGSKTGVDTGFRCLALPRPESHSTANPELQALTHMGFG